jgi:hypothetical protein
MRDTVNDADHHAEDLTYVLPDGRKLQAPRLEYTRTK